MHELAGTRSVLQLAEQQARAVGAGEITDVYLAVGELSTFTEESVRFYWETLCPGTLAARARVHFRHEPAAWVCLDCGRGHGTGLVERCPECGSTQLKLTSGLDFYLEAVGWATARETAELPGPHSL